MNAEQAREYINSYTWSASRAGLDRMRKLLSLLHDPQDKLRFIHIAGTNGKGSTAAMTACVLRAAGYRTGLFTSPHVVNFNERIRVDGENISDDELSRLTARVAQAADTMSEHPSQFELILAIGLLHFLKCSCEIVVLEVGMGGRLDATNVIGTPLAAVITSIGLDHTQYLGDSIEQIACEKAGIIKEGGDVVAYANDYGVMKVLSRVCSARGARLYEAEDVTPIAHSLSGQSFSYHAEVYELGLLGANQLKNAAVCLKIIELIRMKGLNITDRALHEGLRSVRWPARFELLSGDPILIVDGGHNPQCAEALAENIRLYLGGGPVTLVIAMLADKDSEGVLEILRPYAAGFITLCLDTPRALSARELAELAGDGAHEAGSVREALDLALSGPFPTVVFGSLYLAGEVIGLDQNFS